MRRLLLYAVLLLPCSGCGYHLIGTSSFLPEDLRVLYSERFENMTTWSDVDQRLDEAIAREWVRRRRFELVSYRKDAEMVFEGTIRSISMVPVTLDQNGRASEYQMTLTVTARLLDIRGDEPEVLWEDKAFSRRTSYDVDPSAVNYFDRQIEAMDQVSRELASALVTAVLEGF
jgi:outer membrane lipopolysaccharide assembly protein LptE/RlpB